MLASALVAACLVVVLGVLFKIEEHKTQSNDAALDLARQLVVMPSGLAQFDVLSATLQQVVDHQQPRQDFAYAGVYTLDGRRVAESVAPPLSDLRPQLSVPPQLSGPWMEKSSSAGADGRVISEVFGPIELAGTKGYYRIGYVQPGVSVVTEELGFLAAVTLPVFLLALLGLLFMRVAVGPLRALNRRLTAQLGQTTAPAVAGSGELTDFTQQFDSFLQQAQSQIERYQKERDVHATAERFLHYRLTRSEAILQALPGGVVILDDAKRITFANSRAHRLLGFNAPKSGEAVDADALVGRLVSESASAQALSRWVLELEASTGSSLPEPLTYKPFSSGSLVLCCSAHAIAHSGSGSDDPPTGYLVLLEDATREALATEKRAEFVAHVSHELKSPLNTLGMCVETLKTPSDPEIDDAEFRLEAINIIGDEVERLAALIGNLLNITQIEMGTMEPERTRVRIADLVEDVFITTKRSALDSTLSFELDIPPKLPAVLIDKDLMRIALNNLVTNAIKYSEPDTTVRVSVSETDDALSISVQDEGIGIAPEEQEAIFRKFYRAEDQVARARGGQGLGLALAQEIVEMHHGALRLESAPGVGSTFTIDLWKTADLMKQAI